jgi:hypothetical protein
MIKQRMPAPTRRRSEGGLTGYLREIIAEHNDHAKATMRAGIEKPGG